MEATLTSQKIGLRNVENFVRKDLPRKLKTDLHDLRMVKEADLECCAYYHLRRFLRSDLTWKVFARKHSRHTLYYTDLIIFRKKYPRIAIELKWSEGNISPKDRASLDKSIRSLRVNKAYFITTTAGTEAYQKVEKKPLEKNRLFEIPIDLELRDAELHSWKDRRRVYTSKMNQGKARKKVTS